MKNEKLTSLEKTSLTAEELLNGGWTHEGSCATEDWPFWRQHVLDQYSTPRQIVFIEIRGSREAFTAPRLPRP